MASNMATCTMAMVRVATNGCCLAVTAQFSALSFHSVIESAPAQVGIASISPATSHQGLAMVNDNNLNFRNFTNPSSESTQVSWHQGGYISLRQGSPCRKLLFF